MRKGDRVVVKDVFGLASLRGKTGTIIKSEIFGSDYINHICFDNTPMKFWVRDAFLSLVEGKTKRRRTRHVEEDCGEVVQG